MSERLKEFCRYRIGLTTLYQVRNQSPSPWIILHVPLLYFER